MAYLLKIGALTFPKGFSPADKSVKQVVPFVKSPRADGGRALTGTMDSPRRFEIHGSLIKSVISNSSDIQADIDSLKSALMAAGPATLYFGRDDRHFRNVQMETFQDTYQPTWYGRMVDITIGLMTTDPFAYGETTNSDTWSGPTTGGTHAIAVGGGAYAQPVFTITLGGSGAQTLSLTLTNTNDGKSLTIVASVSGQVSGGDVIVIDTLGQTVTRNGNSAMSLFDGLWVDLSTGTTTLKVTFTGTATIASIQTQWANRWR